MKDLRGAIRAFIEERDWEQFHSPKNLAMALSVELKLVLGMILIVSAIRIYRR